VRDDDPQRTQEWDARPDFDKQPVAPPGSPAEQAEAAAGATASEAEATAAAREAKAQAERAEAEARGAELRQELRETDARRAEEETAKAHESAEAAEKEEENLSRKERKAKERAEQAAAEAEQARRHAAEADRLRQETAPAKPPANLSGANVMSPGLGSDTDPAIAASAAAGGDTAAYRAPTAPAEPSPLERPEVVAGIAFAGSFLLARILKRLVD
jgi:hypothetical protein